MKSRFSLASVILPIPLLGIVWGIANAYLQAHKSPTGWGFEGIIALLIGVMGGSIGAVICLIGAFARKEPGRFWSLLFGVPGVLVLVRFAYGLLANHTV